MKLGYKAPQTDQFIEMANNGSDYVSILSKELKKFYGEDFVTVFLLGCSGDVNHFDVSKKDYEDAQAILQWDENNEKGVSKSCAGERMNEVKTHGNWAAKILILADIYGIN